MLRKGFFVLLMCSLHAISFSQKTTKLSSLGQMTGSVADGDTKQPIEYASILVFRKGHEKPETGATSNAQGQFTLKELSFDQYSVKVEAVGYKSFSIDSLLIDEVHVKLQLGKIQLNKNVVQLQTISISGTKKLIENKIDKIVFNAENDISSQGGVATDLLKKIPMVSVDIDGNVSLGGTGGIRFLINGKPSTAYGSNITDVLQSIPATEISKIEVVTSPGAKYDAEGLGGIINIVLKSNRARGYNASINGSVGTRIENGSINANVRDKNFGVNLYVSQNANLLAATPKTMNRITQDPTSKNTMNMDQTGTSDVKRHGGQSGLNLDWTYKKRNSFTASVTHNNNLSLSHGFNNQQLITRDASSLLLNQLNLHNETTGSWGGNGTAISASYKRTFAKEDREFAMSFVESFNHNLTTSSSMQYALPANTLNYGSQTTNRPHDRSYEFQADYSEPLNAILKLNLGVKSTGMHIMSASHVSTASVSKPLATNPYLSNALDYDQHVSSVYSELEFPLTKKLDAKIGGRYEHTETVADYSSVLTEQIKPLYNSFVPSVFMMHKIDDDRNIKLNFTRRMRRPWTDELNPIINVQDPKNMTVGNPFLLPQFGSRIELSYNQQMKDIGNWMVQLFYRGSHRDIQPYVTYYQSIKVGDSTYYNVNLSRNENIGFEENWGVNLYADLKVNDKLSFRPNIFYYYRRILNSIDSKYDAYSNNYRSTLNLTYRFSKYLVSEFFGNFNSARNEVQGKYPSYTSYSFALKRQFNNRKGSIGLVANNPFALYIKQPTMITGPNFISNTIRYIPSRSFGVSVSWRFGKLEFKKDKRNDDEDQQSDSHG